MVDDFCLFLVGVGEVVGYVDECDDWDGECVVEVYEVVGFFVCFDV